MRPPGWPERAADAAIVGFLRLLAWMPWVAAVVIGTCLTWFNRVLLGHLWWLSLLYGFSIPLLLAFGFHRMYRDADGARSEAGCACGLLPLILFLILLPLFVRATKKAMAGTGHAVSSGSVTQKQSR